MITGSTLSAFISGWALSIPLPRLIYKWPLLLGLLDSISLPLPRGFQHVIRSFWDCFDDRRTHTTRACGPHTSCATTSAKRERFRHSCVVFGSDRRFPNFRYRFWRRIGCMSVGHGARLTLHRPAHWRFPRSVVDGRPLGQVPVAFRGPQKLLWLLREVIV
jgi:hypothetical protein